MSLPYTRAEVKDRVRATWRGGCNTTIPSFSSDFKQLNPAAIAHDIKLAASHGFWGTLIASESGTTVDEYVQFMEIAQDAAPDDFRLVAHLSFSTLEESLHVAKAAETLGYEAALPSYPPAFRPKTPADVVEYTRHIADQTGLALILFDVMTWGFHNLDPTGFPVAAVEEMVKFETAAALKFEAGGVAMTAAYTDIYRRVHEHVVVEVPLEQYIPMQIDRFDVQWFGTSLYEQYGDRVPKMIAALQDGKWDEGMEIFWSYQAARMGKSAFMQSAAGGNLIHRNGWKYASWLQGYSGGLVRMPHMRLLPPQMKALRASVVASGFEISGKDEDFYAGRYPL
jgi:dihydrodipicolinate synthase/N-acetylneuraminate lyase